jgi:predicted Zn finger-like uncharacterized protein
MLTTVCASCNTEFRVTWEQLKSRDGRVRCGQCHSVFNALATLNRHGEDDARAPGEIAPPSNSTPEVSAAPLPDSTTVRLDREPAPVANALDTPPVFEFGPQPSVKRRWWWAPLATLLLLALLGQALFYFRGAIALLLPEAKSYINELCAELGCEVPLPRRAELISIETSDLQADPTNPGVMVLLATLRNRAAFPQAFPALELTLTNDRDQPLARRVLQAGDYLADKAEAFDASSEKQIRLHVEAGALKASGYRLYLFYP